MLVGPQFTLKSPDPVRYERFVKMVDDIGAADHVPVLSRYAMMKSWSAKGAKALSLLLVRRRLAHERPRLPMPRARARRGDRRRSRSKALGQPKSSTSGISAMRRRVWRHGTVSAVGFGAMSFGGFYGPTTEAEFMRTLARGARSRRRFLGHRQRLWRRALRTA